MKNPQRKGCNPKWQEGLKKKQKNIGCGGMDTMKRIMNFCLHYSDLERYKSREDLYSYYRGFGLDGIELLDGGAKDEKSLVEPEDVIGIHLRYFPCWYCLWSGDTKSTLEEFGDWEEVRKQFGGTDREAILRAFQENLEFARSYRPKYVVFHVSDVLLSEAVTRRHRYSDEEIVDGAAEILNCIFTEEEEFELLLENLWWPGLQMTRPEITYRLLEQVHYPRTGIMLDTGHLLHTNTAIRSQEEGASYIREVLSQYEDLSMIRGVHFHQTLSGAYVEEQKKHPPVLKGSYLDKCCALAEYIHRVDSHDPFTCRKAQELIEWLDPEYLVYELLSASREEHEQYMLGCRL